MNNCLMAAILLSDDTSTSLKEKKRCADKLYDLKECTKTAEIHQKGNNKKIDSV